jgi:4-amino-4-deoxy-L-arabinose transferase-like glycosyltransferase
VASSGLPLTEGRTGGQETQLRRIKWLLLAAIILLAAFFRLYRIDSLPPGDGYDPAFYGIDALKILDGARPIFLATNYGREPLFSYAVAVAFLVLGASTQAIHITSAVFGILAVPAVFLVAEELFVDEDGLLSRFGGLAAALMMAVSYWHLNWSRYGVRAILVPLFAATTLAFLWRGLRTGKLAAFLLCGVSLGLSMYTYQAARMLPLLMVIGFAAVAREHGAVTRRDWSRFLIVAAVATLIFAPLGLYFAAHPESSFHRVRDVFVIQGEQSAVGNLRAVLNQALDALLTFSFVGDSTPYSTIPGRPSLNPFFSALFLLGIGVSLTHVRKLHHLFLLTWLGLMLVPAILAGHGSAAKRAIGTLPAVAMLIAVGALIPLVTLRRWLGDRLPAWANRLSAAWGVMVLCGFAYSGVITYRDYFIRWASNPNLPTHFEAGISAIGDYIGDLSPEERVYTSPELPSHPAMRFHSGLRDDIRGYNGRVCLVVPRTTTAETTYVIVPRKDGKSLDLLKQTFSEGTVTHRGAVGRDPTHFLAYRIPAGIRADLEPARRLAARWSERIRLLGYDLDQDTYRAGETVELTLYYQDLEPMGERYTAFVHLLGPDNPATGSPLWAQNDSEPCYGFYPTTSWHRDEVLLDRIEIPIPDGAPSGTYRLGTGFYDVVTQERLAVASENAPTDHDVVTLGEIRIEGVE